MNVADGVRTVGMQAHKAAEKAELAGGKESQSLVRAWAPGSEKSVFVSQPCSQLQESLYLSEHQ